MKRILATVMFIAASASAENVELALRIDTRPIDPKRSVTKFKSIEPQKATTETVHVTLGRDFIVIAHPDRTTILDFAKRLRFDASNKRAASVSSLFATVGGREREMVNRQYLVDMLERSGVGASIPLAISEHDLSVPANPPVEGVTRDSKGDVIRFRWQKARLGEYTTDMLDASPSERDAFAKFIRYDLGGHPRFLTDIKNAAGIPRRVTMVQEVGGGEHRITVTQLERKPDAPYTAPSSVNMELASHEKWGPILERAQALRQDGVKEHVQQLEAAADAAFLAARPMTAFLLYMEAYLTLGDAPAGLLRNGPSILSDPSVARLQAATRPANAQEARTALGVLEETRKANPAHAHVIRIFEANIQTNLGETESAYESFHAVLSSQPAIAGVWHDLGDVFLGGYDADAAWNCWDIGRRIAPGHGLMKEIDERERTLLAKYPDFF